MEEITVYLNGNYTKDELVEIMMEIFPEETCELCGEILGGCCCTNDECDEVTERIKKIMKISGDKK